MLTIRDGLIGLTIAAAIALGITLFIYFKQPGELEVNGFHLLEPESVTAFSLTSTTNGTFDVDDLKGRWTFLYFGYTFCPDACPLTLVLLSTVQQLLAEKKVDQEIAYIFVSVDPERDTLQILRDYTKYFNAKFGGATGTHTEIDKLTDQFGVFYSIDDHEPGEKDYVVYHPSELFLVNPDAQLQAILRYPEKPEVMAQDFLNIRAQYQHTKNLWWNRYINKF